MNTEGGRLMSLSEAERLGYRAAGTPRAEVLQQQLSRAQARQASGEGASSANLERVGTAESMLQWHGTDTPSLFARHQQSFSSLVAIMESKSAQLAATGQQRLLPVINREVLTEPVDHFIGRYDGLRDAWNALSREQRARFLGESGGNVVGGRRPDIAEFFLDRRTINLIDITEDPLGRLHRFKSDFYKAVMEAICGPQGPRVYTQDINPLRPMLGARPR